MLSKIVSAVKKFLPLVIFLLLGFTIYSNTFSSPFVFDDLPNILNNSKIRHLFEFLGTWNFKQFRFIGYLSFSLNYQIHRYDLFGYHLVNLMIHVANTVLVW